MPNKRKRAAPVAVWESYEFLAYPVEYHPGWRWQKDPKGHRYRGWDFGLLSRFTFGSLKEAKRAIDRLRRVYQLTKRAHLLKDPSLLKIERGLKQDKLESPFFSGVDLPRFHRDRGERSERENKTNG